MVNATRAARLGFVRLARKLGSNHRQHRLRRQLIAIETSAARTIQVVALAIVRHFGGGVARF